MCSRKSRNRAGPAYLAAVPAEGPDDHGSASDRLRARPLSCARSKIGCVRVERNASPGSTNRVSAPRENGSSSYATPGLRFLEIGLLVAWDRYDGQAPAAGVVTGLARVADRPVVVVANDATVKAGSWWPETITKILRAQEIAMRCRVPIVYLVDSAGVNLPYQGGVFPASTGEPHLLLQLDNAPLPARPRSRP